MLSVILTSLAIVVVGVILMRGVSREEDPDSLVGKRIKIFQAIGLRLEAQDLPIATVVSYEGPNGYRVEFEESFYCDGAEQTGALVRATYVPSPISGTTATRDVEITGFLDSGRDFIGRAKRADN